MTDLLIQGQPPLLSPSPLSPCLGVPIIAPHVSECKLNLQDAHFTPIRMAIAQKQQKVPSAGKTGDCILPLQPAARLKLSGSSKN